MAQKVADVIGQRSHAWDMRRVFGVPADGVPGDDSARCGPAWDEALAADHPRVIEVKSGPDVPPPSPALTLQQARKSMPAPPKGDPEEGGAILGTAKQVLASVLPGSSRS